MTQQGEFRQVITVFINTQALANPESDDHFMPTLFKLLQSYGGYLCRVGPAFARRTDAGN
jgi:hypothetical protein